MNRQIEGELIVSSAKIDSGKDTFLSVFKPNSMLLSNAKKLSLIVSHKQLLICQWTHVTYDDRGITNTKQSSHLHFRIVFFYH